jgi:hypothetical protein
MTKLPLVAFAAASALGGAQARAEVCIDRAAGQAAANSRLCVSSVLRPQAGNTYGPENLGGDTAVAWCEGAPGSGQGEYIRILYSAPVSFQSVILGNGYAKSRTTFFNNARARTVRIETGDGLSYAAELPDRSEARSIRLPRRVNTDSVRLTIVDVYGGDRHQDLCLHHFTPNFAE